MIEEKDQDTSEVEEKTSDQSEDAKSKETDKEPETKASLDDVVKLVQGLQKGYTLTRQEISEIRDNLNQAVERVNTKTQTTEGDEEYLTVGKLRNILAEQAQTQAQAQEQRRNQADKYIDDTLTTLRAEGVVNSKSEEEELMNFALEMKEPDLRKAANIFGKIKEARTEGEKEKAKKAIKKEEGSKVGTSSTTPAEESRGVNYDEVVKGDFW